MHCETAGLKEGSRTVLTLVGSVEGGQCGGDDS